MTAAPLSFAFLLLQWTLLLALGWGVHVLLRHGHPRWRLMLWRSVLCFAVTLPLLGLLRVPRVAVPVPTAVVRVATAPTVERGSSLRDAPVRAPSALVAGTVVTRVPDQVAASTVDSPTVAMGRAYAPIPWAAVLAGGWIAGSGWALFHLLRQQARLRRIVRGAVPASAPILSRAWQIQEELGLRRRVAVRVTAEIASPCLCGVWTPVILLPRRLVEELPPAELSALLAHELAHQVRHDLAWCIAWRVVRVVGWFHPLVWRVPAAHLLACEEEADRVAAGRSYEGEGYARLLAQLALRILRAPGPETPLALSATSHLARRLVRLGGERMAAWRPVHSLAGLAVVGGLLVLTAGWQFAQAPAEDSSSESAVAQVAAGSLLVTVQDEVGRPVEGVVLTPFALRAAGENRRGSSYRWRPSVHGAALKAVTDRAGQARVTYPVAVVPEEKLLTGEIDFSVDHPEFSRMAARDLPVDGSGKPVRLKRGIRLRVAGQGGATRERVTEIVPVLLGEALGVPADDWQRGVDGSLAWSRLSPGKHFLLLAGRLASGEMVYSDGVAFFGEQRDAHDYTLELKPGVRLEGRLDAKVPRPVKNAWVQLSVHSDEANTDANYPQLFTVRSGTTGFWFTYRPVAPDGSFVFESLPRGDFVNVIAYGDGFISANGVEVPRQALTVPTPPRRATRGIPQAFDVKTPLMQIELVTEATATLTVVAKAGGKPITGAKVGVWPNVAQLPTGSRLFAAGRPSSEAPFRAPPPLPEPDYTALTDATGRAVLRNVPSFTTTFSVQHDDLEVPLQEPANQSMPARFRSPPSRYLAIELTAGQPATVEVILQPKGREFAGTAP